MFRTGEESQAAGIDAPFCVLALELQQQLWNHEVPSDPRRLQLRHYSASELTLAAKYHLACCYGTESNSHLSCCELGFLLLQLKPFQVAAPTMTQTAAHGHGNCLPASVQVPG